MLEKGRPFGQYVPTPIEIQIDREIVVGCNGCFNDAIKRLDDLLMVAPELKHSLGAVRELIRDGRGPLRAAAGLQ